MRAWLYYRLSRDEDEEMNSLQNQRQILVDYAEQNGYEIVGESFDDNVSGMTFNRKGLGELEIAVDESKIDVVLVKDTAPTKLMTTANIPDFKGFQSLFFFRSYHIRNHLPKDFFLTVNIIHSKLLGF